MPLPDSSTAVNAEDSPLLSAADLRAAEPVGLLDLSDALPPPPPLDRESEASSLPNASASETPQAGPTGWGFSWGGLVDAMKKQTEVVRDVYKRDIVEFVHTLQTESTSTFNQLTHTIKEGAKQLAEDTNTEIDATSAGVPVVAIEVTTSESVSEAGKKSDDGEALEFVHKIDDFIVDKADKFFSGVMSLVGEVVKIVPADEDEQDTAEKNDRKEIIFSRKSAHLAALLSDETTYTSDPAEHADEAKRQRFTVFSEIFNLEAQKDEVKQVLNDKPPVKTLHDTLVPGRVSEYEFWLRYFWTVEEVDRKESERKKVINGTNYSTLHATANATEDDDAFSWGSDDEDEEPNVQTSVQVTAPEKPNELPEEATVVEASNAEITIDEGKLQAQRPRLSTKRSMDSTDSFEMLSTRGSEASPMDNELKDDEKKDDDWGTWE
ncbi:hypothetical protein BC832DRAFT_541784 [Gaertneriomyces semiglobifer]|nr:hypothetical protein BC832DRAFT_541784 [Gaertneriomyces semiglobifer]